MEVAELIGLEELKALLLKWAKDIVYLENEEHSHYKSPYIYIQPKRHSAISELDILLCAAIPVLHDNGLINSIELERYVNRKSPLNREDIKQIIELLKG